MASMKQIVVDPLSDNNPITVQMLGICSALAVTTSVEISIIMSIAVVAVMSASNTVISAMRKIIPSKIRMIVEMVVIASLVIIVDQLLKAFMYEASLQLSVFVGLIITNCIVMGRAEAFAMQNPPLPSLIDGIGNGLGYSIVLIMVGSGREILANGTWLNIPIFPEGYQGNGIAALPVGAFMIIGLIIWVQRTITKQFKDD